MTTSPQKTALRPCPLCAHAYGEPLHSQRFVLPDGHPLAEGYEVLCCERCGFVYADTTVTQRDYDEFYARLSKYTDNRTSTGGGASPWDAERMRETARVIAEYLPRRDARILDVGCANGGLLQALGELGFRALCGIDPAPACARQAAQSTGAQTFVGSLSQIPAEAGHFDLIILSHVLEHVKDLRPALEGLAPFMASGASLYVETPNAMRYADFVVAPFQDFNTEHINHFSVQCMANLLHASGFDAVGAATKEILSAPDMPYPALYVFAPRLQREAPALTPERELRQRVLDYIALSRRAMQDIDAHLRAVLPGAAEVIVWGTGQLAMKLLSETALAKARIAAFVDGNPQYRGQRLRGVPILSPSELISSPQPILITTLLHERAIRARIKELGLSNPVWGVLPRD